MDLLIETINGMDIGWKADVCKLQKHHASYGSHCGQDNDEMLLQLDDDVNDKKDEDSKQSKDKKKLEKDAKKVPEKPKFGFGAEFPKALE